MRRRAVAEIEYPALAADLSLSNKWRIEVHEGANNTGTLLFRVTPDKGTATDVLVNIDKGRSENGVATDIKNTFTPNPMMFNVVGEIRGTDKADEVVMLGAHFDTWHASPNASVERSHLR